MQTAFKVSTSSRPSKTLAPVQTLNHYLSKIQIFEFVSAQQEQLLIKMNKPCFLMYIDVTGNYCQLGYCPKGLFQRKTSIGTNQVMIIIFRPDWLIYRCKSYAEFDSLAASFRYSSQEAVMLPDLGTARSLYKSFKQLGNCCEPEKERDYYLFIDDALSKYQRKLQLRKSTNQHHHQKAEAIAGFINENFATELVENIPSLAARFMVSERHLARLAKSTFGIPLHSQVIKIRMNASLNQLLNTDMSLQEVARQSGYRDPYYFSRAFKKCFRVSPKFVGWQENTATVSS